MVIFMLFVFHYNFHRLNLFFSESFCCNWRCNALKFGDDIFPQMSYSFNLFKTTIKSLRATLPAQTFSVGISYF
jgi:hypothetical protein